MTADAFGSSLRKSMPSFDALIDCGISKEEAAHFRRDYEYSRIKDSNEFDRLLDLCLNFDLATIEISLIRFARPKSFRIAY
jgi:hypothetical protein